MLPKVLIVDAQSMCSELLAVLFQTRGFDPLIAAGGPEALQKLRDHPVKLVLMDIELEGMDGLELIAHIRRASPHMPIIILTASHERSNIIRSASLGVTDYMLKSHFSADRVIARVRQLLEHPDGAAHPATTGAAPRNGQKQATAEELPVNGHAQAASTSALPPPSPADYPKLLTREQTMQRVDHVSGGKTIAGVVAQVISLASSPNTDLVDLVRALESDPVLATRVMQLANSAFAVSRGRVRTVEDAVRNVGLREIQNLAINIGIFGSFPPNELDGFNSMRCWQHSFAVAELVGVIARERNALQACVNHLVGLCHDLGEILLRQHFTREYHTIVEFAMRHEIPVHDVESVALGIRHPELLSRLLSRIGLPQPVVQAIREFYERQVRGQSAGMSPDTRRLTIANQVAHGMLLASSTQSRIAPISRVDWRSLNTEGAPPDLDPISKRNEILTVTNTLARLPVDDEKKLLSPLVPRVNNRVWYLRPETYISLDPLAFALTLTTDLTIASTMPTPSQWHSIDALVAVGVRPGTAPLITSELAEFRAAAGRGDLPILALSGQDTPINDRDNICLRPYPIRLQDLHEWLMRTSCASAQPAAVAGV